MVDDNSSRQVVFSHPRAFAPGSSAAGMSYDNRHSYTIDPPVTFRGQPAPRTNSTVAVSQAAVSNTPSELFDSLIHTFLYDGVRERPRTARGRQELSSAQAWPSQGELVFATMLDCYIDMMVFSCFFGSLAGVYEQATSGHRDEIVCAAAVSLR